MIPGISRRAALQGVGAGFAAAVLPGLDALTAPPPLPDIETRLGAEAIAFVRSYYVECLSRFGPAPFASNGRFAISNAFRTRLALFLTGEDNVSVRRDEEAGSASLEEAHVRWQESCDRSALGLLQTVLRQEVHIAFDNAEWHKCAAFYGELRDEPGTFAVLLTADGHSLRRDHADMLFRDYWIE